jgi:hypothetical protein
MVSRLIFLHLRGGVESSRDGVGYAEPTVWSSVQACRQISLAATAGNAGSMPRRDEAGLRTNNSVIPDSQEKLRVELLRCPYRKPTQVGGVSIPRRVRERWLRNSAK